MTVATTAAVIPAAQSPTTIAATEDRIPGEFLGFWQRVDGRRVRRARNACQRLLRFDPIPDDAHVRAFAHGYYDADPVAEAFVDEVYLSRGVNDASVRAAPLYPRRGRRSRLNARELPRRAPSVGLLRALHRHATSTTSEGA